MKERESDMKKEKRIGSDRETEEGKERRRYKVVRLISQADLEKKQFQK